jgi:uncharacterized protein (DUF697 family)
VLALTVVGGLINGSVAAAMTYAIGTAVSEVCATLSEKVIGGNLKEIEAFLPTLSGY